ncbi:MAG TPA: thioredoxin family protein [Daejeonella sp.]|nr:thioredoxin family protein [Daejeonella sp.]
MKKILFALFMMCGLMVKAQTAGYQVGDKVADFKLKNVDSKMVSMADFKQAKGFIVIFTCNTCPVSKAYEDRIIALNSKYAPKGYPVLAINPNDPKASPGDSFELMQERAKSKKFGFPYLLDPDHLITKTFGANRTPHVFIVQKTNQGNFVQYIGAIDNDTENTDPDKILYTENALQDLLTGKTPALSFTKAVGCTIKWKKAE